MDLVTKKLTNFVCTVRIGGGVEDGNLPKLYVYLKNYQKWMIELLVGWLQHPCAIAYMRYHQTKLIVHQSSHKNLTDSTWHKKDIVCGSFQVKVENILKGSLDLIPSPSPSVKIQIMGGKVCLRCKGKTLLGIVNKCLKAKSLLTSPSNVLPYYLK